MLFFWILCFAFFVFLSILAYKNAFFITIDLWPFDYHLNIIFPLVIVLTLGVGLIIGGGVVATHLFLKKKTVKASPPSDIHIA